MGTKAEETPKVSLKDAELSINLGGHACVVKGSFDLVSDDFARRDTVAGALIVEDRANATLIAQLAHKETVQVDGEDVEVDVTYNPLDASRIETPVEKKAAEVKAPAAAVTTPASSDKK